MQCHAVVLDTTGTTYARQQPRYIERERKNERLNAGGKKWRSRKNGEKNGKKKIRETNTPETITNSNSRPKRGKTKHAEPEVR